ncbi:MAG: hypothetical protein ACKO2D_05805 [Chloroflexota bacterium]
MQDETIAPHGVTIASRRRLLVGVGALVSACGASDTAASPVVIASTGRPLGLAPLFAMARPSDALAAAVPSTASLPPRPVISLRIATTIDGAINLVSTGTARAAVVPRGTAAATPGWKSGPGIEVTPISPAALGSPGPVRLVVRRESVAGPRLASGRLAPRVRPYRFAYLPTPWGLPVDALVGGVIPQLVQAVAGSPINVDGLPLVDGGRWEAFATEIEAVTALVDDRADAALLWPEGAAYALRDPAFALAATLATSSAWAEGATPVVVGSVPATVEAWLTTLGAALDGPDALALLRLAYPERDPLTLAGAVALRRPDWSPTPG